LNQGKSYYSLLISLIKGKAITQEQIKIKVSRVFNQRARGQGLSKKKDANEQNKKVMNIFSVKIWRDDYLILISKTSPGLTKLS